MGNLLIMVVAGALFWMAKFDKLLSAWIEAVWKV